MSNVFVPIATLPDWLQPIAEWNPTSTLTRRACDACGATRTRTRRAIAWRRTDPVLVTLIWVVVILVVFAPLGVRRYRSMSR